jgi:inner membrane protein
MDVATHAGIGFIGASPFLASQPELGLGILAGSVLPDLDALLRLGGKEFFLRGHQRWSHALPIQAVFSVACGFMAWLGGLNGLELGGGLFVGLAVHSLLDLTNTYGVAWLFPFSRRRACLSWVFFIDAVVLVATAAMLVIVVPLSFKVGNVSPTYAIVFLAFLFAYILAKGMLRKRALGFCPNARSMTPSALVPWHYFGTEREGDFLNSFRINALTGGRTHLAKVTILDDNFAPLMSAVPEYRLMRELSTEYHVVQATPEGAQTHVFCRDMRIRNFGTTFGDLEVWLDANKQIIRSRFHA